MFVNKDVIMIVNFKSEFLNRMAKFQPASTGLDHGLVVCDLTQISAEGSGCRWGQLVSVITIHDGAVVQSVDGLLDFVSLPLLSAQHLDIIHGHR